MNTPADHWRKRKYYRYKAFRRSRRYLRRYWWVAVLLVVGVAFLA